MPLSKQHKLHSREKILESAVQLFSSRGFNKVSIDEIMLHAGMTRGAFYAHFDSKESLYAEAITTAAANTEISNALNTCIDNHLDLEKLISGYLSLHHVQQKSPPCPLAFLATDVANEEKQVRQTYTKTFHSLINAVIGKSGKPLTKETALAITAMMIGSVTISRALTNEETVLELLDSSKSLAIELLNSHHP